ncbi:hypothetical protein A5844_001375 [Enterococcus sp. 10A9_DIV0425]|uniref:Uncharacterized protein n=1 Tax=Candidatus Enterococcus wittei TaxID=1987383 RepID=A0A242K0Q6_9ENTE|nr:hypothetical protein A5844_001375 [Enterococcus sp. 10A9_DIV0425]
MLRKSLLLYSTSQTMNRKKIIKKHPYLSIIIFGLIASTFWITIEYIVNKNFVANGIYGLLFYYVIALSSVKYNLPKKNKK